MWFLIGQSTPLINVWHLNKVLQHAGLCLNHLFITVTVSLDVPLCQALRHVYPAPVTSPPPAAMREFLHGPPPSRGETTTPTHTANQPFGNNYVHQIMVWPFIKATTFYCSVYCLADLYRLCCLAQCDYYLSTLESLPKVVTHFITYFEWFHKIHVPF